jgi:predicted HTH domain antitoxin
MRISIIIPSNLKQDLDVLKSRMHLDLNTLIRLLLADAVQEKKLEVALEEYHKGKVSLGNAADIASLSMWEFVTELHALEIPINIAPSEFEREIQQIHDGYYDHFILDDMQR